MDGHVRGGIISIDTRPFGGSRYSECRRHTGDRNDGTRPPDNTVEPVARVSVADVWRPASRAGGRPGHYAGAGAVLPVGGLPRRPRKAESHTRRCRERHDLQIFFATFGRHVIATVGQKITHLTPSRGFAAELAAASTIVLASGTGIPISTTHTLVGAVLGVGMARGITAIDLSVVGRIFFSWAITIPVGAVLSIIFFYSLKLTFG